MIGTTGPLKFALAVGALVLVPQTDVHSQSPTESSLHYMRGIGLLTGTIGSCPMLGGMSDFTEKRIAFVKKELAITEAQNSAWEKYAAALRDHLERMLGMQQSVMKVLESRNPVERMRNHIAAMDDRLASLKALEPALAELYSALSPDQQAKSDEILTGMGCTM